MGPLVWYCPLQEEEGKEGSEEDEEEDEVDGEAYEEHEKEDDEDFAASVGLLEHQKFQNLQSAGDEVEGDVEEEGQQ